MIAWLLTALLLIGQTSVAQIAPPQAPASKIWKVDSEKDTASGHITSFSAVKSSLKGQGVLTFSSIRLAEGADNLDPTTILGEMYRNIEDFQLIGSKSTSWGGHPARLASFKATFEKRRVAGRSVIASFGGEARVLLLVCNLDVFKKFEVDFNRLHEQWQFQLSPSQNVIGS